MTKRKADDEIKPNSGLCEGESSSISESASPVGKAVKIYRGKNWEKRYYEALEVSGNLYNLEDTVLLQPEEGERPFVAIIKEIKASNNGLVALTVQWFYRPEEAGEPCHNIHEPEVLYSLHLDEVPALSLLQKCTVHYLPPDIELPDALERPCYIVQRFYDCKKNKIWDLTDCLAHPSLSGSQRKEIARLLNKTYSSLPLFQRWVLEAEQDPSSKGKGIVHCQSLKGLYTAGSPKNLKRSIKSDSPVSDLRVDPSIESATPETAPSGTSVQISTEDKHIADPKNQANAGIVSFQCKVEQQLSSRSDLSFSKDMAAEKKPFAEKPDITTRFEGRAKEKASQSNTSSQNDAVGKRKRARGTPKSSKAAVQSSLNSTERNSMYLELEPDKLLQTGQPRKGLFSSFSVSNMCNLM